MTRQALVNARIALPVGLRDGLCLLIEDGRIAGISSGIPDNAEIVDLGGGTLVPGYIDTQVNGGGGKLFNDDPSVETIRVIAETHRRFGTTGLLPTLISDDLHVVEAAIRASDEAIEAGVPGVLGRHIEGPFLDPARRGIHDGAKLRPLEDSFLELLASARHGRTLVTLSPESATPEQIAWLTGQGVIVAAGHSDAPYETVRTMIDAGITGFTHLFNAMSQLVNRAPGMVGAALDDDATYAGLIVDGHHLHPATVRIAVRAKGPQHLMLVTDAMPSVGTEDPEFILQGRRIRREGDKLLGDDDVLAGSTLTMESAVQQVIAQTGITLGDALAMASATPARFLDLQGETGAIAPGLRADLVLLDADLAVRRSWIGGVSN